MKKLLCFLIIAVMLCGCSGGSDLTDRAMALRGKLQAASGCVFDATVTADYGDKTYTFAMGCRVDADGNLSFTVKEPENIAGISGVIDNSGGKLTFDDHMLAFPMLADGQVTPISGPWILMKTLLGGYLTAVSEEDDLLHLTIHDSYEEDALQMEIWLDGENAPVCAEIFYDGRRIVTMTIENFQMR